MKKVFITAVFMMLVVLAFAQTGLFGLSYGSSRAKAAEILEERGFSPAEDGEINLFLADEVSYAKSIRLNLDDDDLVKGWVVCYTDEVNDDCEEAVIDALVSWHGDDYDLDYDWDDAEYYVWSLENGKYVEAYWDYDYEYFWVEYY